jgi:hypothetical protein
MARMGVWLTLLFGALGCAGPHYIEEHEIRSLTVVFLDKESLQQQWKSASGHEAMRFSSSMSHDLPSLKVITGFYDFSSNTLYCSKWDYEVCGHELHHAVLGQFHRLE